ncbi:MAG: LamG-like jellyroll fold domain-containing protein [Tenuifilum sp.]|uniref:LamG-like jellyroll fold domain-containing protein n=1 Tax=Tenuifilum sp. TaxID=2760880 RepID=UPI0030A3D6D6
MELTIIRRNQSHYTVTIVKGEVTQKLLSQDVATLTVHSYTPIDFMVGDRAELLGSWYYINRLPKLEKGNGYTYEVELEGEMYRLRHAQFLLYDNTGMAVESDFSLMGNLEDIARLAISNLNRVYGSGAYLLGDCPQTDTRNHIINNENVLAVLQRVCSDYGYEFELIRAGSVIELRIGTVGTIKSLSLQYGAGKGLYKLDRLMVNDTGIVTRLFVYGGNRNIPSGYRDFSRRLKLPNNPDSYIEDADAIATYGVIEGTKIFEDIYPRRTGVITEVGAPNAFTDSTMDFDLNETDAQGQTKYLIPGNPAKVSFISGNLAGYEFEIAAYSHASKSFTIKYYTDERGYKYPSADDAFKINVGDQYVLLDIHMPQSYIDAAEAELLSQATSLLAEKKSAKVRYSVEIDPIFAKQECINLNAGDIIRVRDTDLNIDRDIRVVSVKRDLLEPYKMSLELGDEVTVSLATQLLDRTSAIEKVVKINQLHDPAKYRTAWRNALELQQMVFDQDGYFESGNIRPLSINTAMLSVGSKAGQFVLNGVVFQPGYNGVANRIANTMGTLSHYAIEDSIRTWVVEAYDYVVPDNNARYIYIKCDLNGSNAQVKYRTDQLKVDAESGYYYFLIGVLHSVQDGYRKISLTYGATTINGKEIKTGRITSQDGQTYFDLDAGEIKGKIVFRSGMDDAQIEQAIVTAQDTADTAQLTANTAQTTANSAQTAATNAQNTANTALINANNALTQLTNIASDNILSPIEKQAVKREWDDIVNEKQKILDQAYPYYDVSTTAYTNAYDALNTYITPLLSNLNTDSTIDGPTFRSKFNTYYLERQNLLNAIAEQARRVAKNGGNFLDWQQLQLCNYPITSAAYTNFATGILGDFAENAIVLAETPFGTMDKVWECNTAAADAGMGGGISTTRYVRVDPNKSYIFYAWVKILDAGNVTVHYGLTPTSNKVINLNTGSMDSNPYFIGSAYNYKLPQNRWLLLTGIVHSKDYTGSGIGLSGIYDPLTKKRLSFKSNYAEFKWYDANVNSISVRVIRAYSYTINSKVQIYGVGIYEMNGQEPSVYSLLSAAKVSTIPVKPSDANLKAFYTFDKSMLFDDSGNGKGLTKYGTRSISQVASDIKGKCLFFDINDTNNGYLYIDDSNYFRIPELTISLWFKFTGFASGQTACGLFSMPYTPRVDIVYSTPTNYARAIVTRTSDSASLTSYAYQIEMNRWYHLTFVQKTGANGYSKLYINGNIVDVVLDDIKFGSGTKFIIGTDGNSETSYRFNGYIDELRFYNKALTDEEIAWLYLNPTQGLDYGSLKTIIDGGLVSSGTIQVGQGNDGDYTVKAGITGEGSADSSVRIWAGNTFTGRSVAPFRVQQDGTMYASKGYIAGWQIDSERFVRIDSNNEFIIDPLQKLIKFITSGEEKINIANSVLPSLSSLITPQRATYEIGINHSPTFTPIEDEWESSGSVFSTNQFYIPDGANCNFQTKIYIALYFNYNVSIWLTDSSGNKLSLIKTIIGNTTYSEYNSYINATLDGISLGTYKILYEYYFRGRDYGGVLIGSSTIGQNTFSYTQQKFGTYIANNGIASYWSASKYLYLSSIASYLLDLIGNAKLMSANGKNGIKIDDTDVRLLGLSHDTNYNLITISSAHVVLNFSAKTYLLSFSSSSYYAVLPNIYSIRSALGLSSSDKFQISIRIICKTGSVNSRVYGRNSTTGHSSTSYPVLRNNNAGDGVYFGVGAGDTIMLELVFDGSNYDAYILGYRP